MKRLPLVILLFVLISACNNNNNENVTASESDVDAARNFIRSALDGRWDDARKFMLQDSLNKQLLDTYEDNYRKNMSRDDKRGYREASIRMPEIKKINDSSSVVLYSNSYKNKVDSLKVVRVNGQWLIDFKYSFPSKDTTN